MIASLRDAGFDFSVRTAFVPDQDPGKLADLLVVDVDSGLADAEDVLTQYRDASRPVLICGLRASRELYGDQDWLARPFSPDGFLAQCQSVLGLAKPPRSAPGEDEANASDPPDDSAPDTQKLTVRDAEQLEEALGLQKGVLSQPAQEASTADTDELSAEELPDEAFLQDGFNADETIEAALGEDAAKSVLELDVEDLEMLGEDDFDDDLEDNLEDDLEDEQTGAQTGSIVGEVARERLDAAALDPDQTQTDLERVEPPGALRSNTLNSTLPDVPAVKLPEGYSADASQAREFPQASGSRGTPTRAPSSHGTGVGLPPQLEEPIRGASRLLADAWGDIGQSARPGDRAEHIRKVLRAALADGLAAATAEIERIPAAPGFSGTLASMSLAALLATVRDRGLRGRVELSIGAEDFVLYLDAQALDEIENLSGNDDALLLDILAKMGCLSQAAYAELQRSLSDEMAPPLQMQLREPGRSGYSLRDSQTQDTGARAGAVVDADDLREARRLRARQLFKKIRQAERSAARAGNFAFMEVVPDGGHAWPVDALGLNVDELLKSAMREDSMVGVGPAGVGSDSEN
jgi:hypothetical protein